MYVDVLRPTSERHPIELLRRPEVRSDGIGSISAASLERVAAVSLAMADTNGEQRCSVSFLAISYRIGRKV